MQRSRHRHRRVWKGDHMGDQHPPTPFWHRDKHFKWLHTFHRNWLNQSLHFRFNSITPCFMQKQTLFVSLYSMFTTALGRRLLIACSSMGISWLKKEHITERQVALRHFYGPNLLRMPPFWEHLDWQWIICQKNEGAPGLKRWGPQWEGWQASGWMSLQKRLPCPWSPPISKSSRP